MLLVRLGLLLLFAVELAQLLEQLCLLFQLLGELRFVLLVPLRIELPSLLLVLVLLEFVILRMLVLLRLLVLVELVELLLRHLYAFSLLLLSHLYASSLLLLYLLLLLLHTLLLHQEILVLVCLL